MVNLKSLSIFLMLISTIYCHRLESQSETSIKESIDSLMSSYYQEAGPGAVIRVVKDHELFFESAYGLSQLKDQTKNIHETIFKIGSMTKQFTAICILKLVEQGKLSLEDHLTDYYPDLFKALPPITIQQMLSHTSGIKDLPRFQAIRKLMNVNSKAQDLIEIISTGELEFQPGEKYKYSNSPYIILGGIIEKVTNMSYGEVLRKWIFQPLDMQSSFFAPVSGIPEHRASGYFSRPDNYADAPEVSHTLMYSAGGIWSTVRDLAKWNEALYTEKILSKKYLEMAFNPIPLTNGYDTNYGFGFRSCEINGTKSIEHGGGVFGYNSYGIRIESEGVYVIILSNFEGGNKYAAIAAQIAALAINRPYTSDQDESALSPQSTDELTGIYVNNNRDTLNIVFEDDRLILRRENKEDITLKYLEDSSFRIQGSLDDQIIFNVEDKSLIWKPRRGVRALAMKIDN